MKTKLAVAFALTAVAIGSIALHSAGQTQSAGGSGFTKSVEVDRGTYFRLKVKLAYKGEPQDFDIVVGCNVRQINYKDNSRTVEVGLVPTLFGRRMSNGKGLVVRPPNACGGQTTANGQVPSDLLPIAVVYDDAETLAFGVAYLSEDAYENPLSVLTFGGATIENANKAEFEEFRRTQPNLVKPASYHTPRGLPPLKERNLAPAAVPMGTGCYGYARFRLVGDELQHAREMWPAEHPRFWRPARNAQSAEALNPATYNRPMQTDREGGPLRPRYELMPGLNNEVANLGMPTRRGGGVVRGKVGGAFPISYYPDIGGWIALPWPSNPPGLAASLLRDGPHIGASIDFRGGQTRGFAYCRPSVGIFPTGTTFADYPDPTKDPAHQYVRMPVTDRVDGIEVQAPPELPRGGFDGPPFIVERDEFIFLHFVIELGSTRGDV
jgi:hypothetical protein